MQISQKAVDYVVTGASMLIEQTVSANENSEEKLSLFKGLETAYFQGRFIEKNFPYVV